MNSCLLSVIGAVLVVATIYDMLTNGSLRHLIHYNAGHNSAVTEDGDNDRDNLITHQQTFVVGTADDEPLISTSPAYGSNCRRVCGSCFCVNISIYANIVAASWH